MSATNSGRANSVYGARCGCGSTDPCAWVSQFKSCECFKALYVKLLSGYYNSEYEMTYPNAKNA